MKSLFTCLLVCAFFIVKAQTMTICGDAIPSGWITTSVNGVCTGSQISRTIQRIDNLPSGSEVNVCGDPTPTGWVTISMTPNCGQYYNTIYTGRRIKRIDGASAGAEMDICGDNVPSGWVTLSITPNCAQIYSSTFSGRHIKKVDGLPTGTELNICGDLPPTGWVTLSVSANCATVANIIYTGRRIRKIDGLPGLPAGTEMDICGDAAPSGWVTLSKTANCGQVANAVFQGRRIKKVEGMPAGSELDICEDPAPSGWITLSLNVNCFQIANLYYTGRHIIKYEGMPYGTILETCAEPAPTGWTILSTRQGCARFGTYSYNGYTIKNGNCNNSFAINVSGGTLTCDPTTTVTLSANVVDPNPVYKWNGPNGFQSTQPTVIANVASTYNLTVTTANGVCGGTATATLLVNKTASTVSIAQSGTLTCTNRSVTLSAGNSNYYNTYKWSGPNNFSLITSQSSISVAVGGQYILAVTGERCNNSGNTTVIENCPTCESSQPGLWTNTAIWSCGRVPLITDRVIVGHLITLPAGSVQSARQLIFKTGGQLNKLIGSRLQLSP